MKLKLTILTIIILSFSIFITCGKKESSRKIAYYTAAMDPSLRVSVEEYKNGHTKSSMGMDLIPVYADDNSNKKSNSMNMKNMKKEINTLKITKREEILADVRVARATYRTIRKKIRTAGNIESDETKVAYVTSYVNGRIEKLLVNFTGATVKKGQILAYIYSPELISTEEEYLKTFKAAQEVTNDNIYSELLSSIHNRLKLWGVTETEISNIIRNKKANIYIPIVSPINGTVIHKDIIEQQYVKKGQPLYHISDLSTVWMKALIYEFEVPFIKLGLPVVITTTAYPEIKFQGHITFVDPTVNPKTRTVTARVEISNSSMQLKPGMFVVATIMANLGKKLVIPKSALLDTGTKKIVYVQKHHSDDGSIYVPRIVRTGVGDDNFIEILKGIKSGEKVVSSAAYLLDSQAELSGIGTGGYSGALNIDK